MDDDEWDDELLSKIDDLESLHLRAAAERQVQQPQPQPHAHADAAFNAVPVPPEQQWACQSCTLLNASGRTTCLVCSTSRGQAFNSMAPQSSPQQRAVAQHNGAMAANKSLWRMPPKKTVQATLPFAARPTEQPPVQSVPAPPVIASPFWQPQRQSQMTLTGNNQPPVPSPSPQMVSRRPPSDNRAREAVVAAIEDDGDDIDDPEATRAFNQTAWPIAQAALQRRPGEDADAKKRYLDVLNRSNFPDIDYEAAQQFVYPTNYPIRDYQLTITEKALYHNTLVSLPTGLGKTLIASVVMYNFYRWFPQGKIVFMAPTKPLVAQQIKACHEIMGIPLSDTAELQGNVPPSMRKVLWKEKRVFFCTPQSMQNDLRHGICEAERFVCVVIDEAHRATGNYAYCLVVQEIEKKTQFFRVLALSATPGAKFEIIQDVIKNLRISHIESRSADDADVKKYTHARQEEVIKCTLSSQITEVKALFLKVFQRILNRLVSGNIIQHRDPEKLSRWYVLQMRERFRQSSTYQANRAAESDLALLVSLLHAKELLTVHGLSSFEEYVNGWIEERETGGRLSWSKKEMMQSTEFHSLVLSLNALGHDMSGKSSSNKKSSSHPKLLKLREVLHEHFSRHATGNSSTRAIVFTQYRTSVTEIVCLLNQMAPLLKVQAFVGQGASGKAKESKGQSQKQQQEIVKKFRNGEFNVLVATCIAEEGLDIGEVDLIVSFDALTSPVRMIQRMGRTGRKRVGKVIILVTEGDEEKKLARSVASAKTVSRAMTTFKSKFVYAKCPRMIPNGIQPELSKLEMLIPEFHSSQIGGKQRTQGQGGTRQRQETSEESSKRRWQLNDLEKAIGNTKYFPPDFHTRARNPIFPVLSRPRQLLRRQRVIVRRNERMESDTFQVRHSTRSAVLRCLVKKVHGVDDQDEIVTEENEMDVRSQSSDDPTIVDPAEASTHNAHERRIHSREEDGTQTDSNMQSHVHDFSFSAVEEDGGKGKTADDTFGSQDNRFFSPGWSASSPVDPVPEKVVTPRVQPPEENAAITPAHAVTPRAKPDEENVTANAAYQQHEPEHVVTKEAAVSKEVPETFADASSKNQDKAQSASAQLPQHTSPLKQLKSPPKQVKGSKKEKLKRNTAEVNSKKEGRVDAKELERGEQLLQRLRDLVVESTAAMTQDSLMSSPMPDVRVSQDTGSQSVKTPQAPLCFPRLRITRRLDFESMEKSVKSRTKQENCVPEPPSMALEIPKPLPSEALKPSTPELTPEDEPDFDLLPAPAFNLLPQDTVSTEDEPMNTSECDGLPAAPTFNLLGQGAIQADDDQMDSSEYNALPPAPKFNLLGQGTGQADGDSMDAPEQDVALPAPTFTLLGTIEPVIRESAKKPRRSLALKSAPSAPSHDVSALPIESAIPSRSVPITPVDVTTPPPRTKPERKSEVSSLAVQEHTIIEIDDDVGEPVMTSSSTTAAKTKPIIFDVDDFEAPATAAHEDSKKETPMKSTSQVKVQSSGHLSGATQNDSCAVCTEVESYEDDPIVYCDGCDLGVHQFCYGIASVPSGKWFCDSCADGVGKGKAQCALCPLRGGAAKKTLCGRWAHVQCFMWLPELQLVQERDVLTLGSLKNLDPDRNTLDCSLCHSRKGQGIVQCAYKRCMDAFHVSCASFAKYKLTQEEQGDGGETLFLAYCPLHRRKEKSPVAQNTKSKEEQAQKTPAKTPIADKNATSPSALFSPNDHDSAQKFRKFRRLKRKYDATQTSSKEATASPVASTDRRSSWGKRIKRSQQYTNGERARAVAMAKMFIEDDVEVQGEDDEDDDEDMDEEADAFDDSFINDSSQLLYSPDSTPGSANRTGANGSKKRKRFSPGDMRAIYARSLIESQDLPAFAARRGQRDFGALPANGIINACLQELNQPLSSTSSLTPRSNQESPMSLVSPPSAASGITESHRAATPTTPASTDKLSKRLWGNTPNERNKQFSAPRVGRFSPSSSNTEPERLDGSFLDDDDDDFETSEVAPPSFNLLSTAVKATPRTTTQEPKPMPPKPLPPVADETKAQSAAEEERSLQARIEANRLKALEKLRERQMKLAQAQSNSSSNSAGVVAQQSATRNPLVHSVQSQAADNSISRVNHVIPPPSTFSSVGSLQAAVLRVSDGNAVPEPPSFSLFPPTLIAETTTDATFSSNMRVPKNSTMHGKPPSITEETERTSATFNSISMAPKDSTILKMPPLVPQVIVLVNPTFSQSAGFPALVAKKTPDCAVEIENSLEADVLVSARCAVIWMTSQQFLALDRQSRGSDILSHPRFRSCSSIFKKLIFAIQVDTHDAGSVTSRTASLQRLAGNTSVEIVLRSSHDELSCHIFSVASATEARGDGLDANFLRRLAYFRTIPCLSYGSSLSLSFRFHNFDAAQVPVKKFNQMHWRRMLPWITDEMGKQIQDYILSTGA
ncbi:Fanconi anemia group m protein, partial [Globisporangium splendens]